jgi:hypothetical protein
MELREAIEPCPFCGCEMKWRPDHYIISATMLDRGGNSGHAPDCPIYDYDPIATTPDRWNARALLTSAPQEGEWGRDALKHILDDYRRQPPGDAERLRDRSIFGQGVSWGMSYQAADRYNQGVCETQIDDVFDQLYPAPQEGEKPEASEWKKPTWICVECGKKYKSGKYAGIHAGETGHAVVEDKPSGKKAKEYERAEIEAQDQAERDHCEVEHPDQGEGTK